MKTIEQVTKAIKFRKGKLEEYMDLLETKMENDEALKVAYSQQFERHHELVALLSFIEETNEQTGCGTAKSQQSSCNACPSACGSKS